MSALDPTTNGEKGTLAEHLAEHIVYPLISGHTGYLEPWATAIKERPGYVASARFTAQKMLDTLALERVGWRFSDDRPQHVHRHAWDDPEWPGAPETAVLRAVALHQNCEPVFRLGGPVGS